MSWIVIIAMMYKRTIIVLTMTIVCIVKGVAKYANMKNSTSIALQTTKKNIVLIKTAPEYIENTTLDVKKDKEEIANESSRSESKIRNCAVDNDDDPYGMKIARSIIDDLKRNGPAGLIHMDALSSAVGRQIKIFNSKGQLKRVIGKYQRGEIIEVEYHQLRPVDSTGHWTLVGNRDPIRVDNDINNCLFNVVALQTGRTPSDLRLSTVQNLSKNIRLLANLARKIVRIREYKKCVLMIGGARYSGSSPRDAAVVIDDSQNGYCHGYNKQGHPRGHASDPTATGINASVEIYSRNMMKTGFLSKHDQDVVGHRALITNDTRMAMDSLNEGELDKVVNLQVKDLGGSLPMAQEFFRGQGIGSPQEIRQVTMVLRHHKNQQNNRDSNVFIHTFYPRL